MFSPDLGENYFIFAQLITYRYKKDQNQRKSNGIVFSWYSTRIQFKKFGVSQDASIAAVMFWKFHIRNYLLLFWDCHSLKTFLVTQQNAPEP